MAENTREIVLDTLLEWEKGKQYSHQLIQAVLEKYGYLQAKERAFIKRLTEGVIERQIELDYILNQYSSVLVQKMKPLIRCLLRMGVYQILYMDSVPDSAVCNEAVKLAGKRKFVSLKGFVNAVLRNIAKNKNNLKYPNPKTEPILYLSVKYSMPEWLISLWIEEYGVEITEKVAEDLLKIHSVSIRFLTGLDKNSWLEYIAQMENQGVKAQVSDYLSYAWQLQNIEGVTTLPGYQEGIFTVQDVSSMLAVEAAGIQKEDIVMDICAAPGGKSLLAAEKAKTVLARDISEHKIAQIQENKIRMKAQQIIIEKWDAVIQDKSKIEYADVLLMDLPCSGLGVIGKKRDIKYQITPEKLDSILNLQKEIFQGSWQYVKKGGILLYSTCTIRLEENEKMIEWICQKFPFEPVALKGRIPEKLFQQKQIAEKAATSKRQEIAKEIKECSIQLFPGYMEADGFFFACLRRKL